MPASTPDLAPVGSQDADGGAAPVLALDVGGTKLAAGVVDEPGRVRSFVVAPTPPAEGSEPVLARLFELGRRAVAESGLEAPGIRGIGIACGGPLDADRGVVSPLHLPGWRDVPIAAAAERAYGVPAVVDNDATAAAAGEHRYGAGRGSRNMVYLTLSTGVGGGVVIDGRLYRGTTGNGAELGHVTVERRGRLCRGCGRRGCLEAYVSGTSIAERTREALAAPGSPPTPLSALEHATAADVAAAASTGDPVARAVWEETVDALTCGLATIVNVFEPELVVLGGGVSRAAEQLLAPIRARIRTDAMRPAGERVRIVASTLGDQVGIVGAAAIAFARISPARRG